jgi:pimeloyl-ACP methyl ester carboxylesterase/class 3 adenylate cyclase
MPPIRYARSGDVNVAYQITGDGNAVDLVLAPGTTSHLAIAWQTPGGTVLIDRLSRFARLLRFDKRGTGMSDRVTDAATVEERADDIRAVMDAAGSEQAFIFGASEGGSMACVFAAMHPERVRGLIVWGCQARFVKSADYPWGVDPEEYARRLERLEREWPSADYVRTWGAGLGDAPQDVVDRVVSIIQQEASPSAVVALERMNGALDIRDALPSIHVPTLIMAREADPICDPDAIRDMAARIHGARLELFPGATHFMAAPWAGIEGEPVWSAIEEFVTGTRAAPPGDRFLTTVLFLDLVGSTERAVSLGDRAWRELLDAHYRVVRQELDRMRGVEVDTAGDGLLATFDGPARAVRFAFVVMRRVKELGLDIRAGVQCGEVERAGSAVRGIAVHLASRIAGVAAPSEVLVSSTIRDLTAGSGLTFVDRGLHALKGVPEQRQLFRALES